MDKEYLEKMAKANRIQTQALAILQRAKIAQIPEQYMRINQSAFRNLLDDKYYASKNQSADKIAEVIFNKPEYLFTRGFIVIDGGFPAGQSRIKAGCAILFRMIACDNGGLYEQGKKLVSRFNSGWTTENTGNRMDYAETLKDEDVLFIGEFSTKDFTVGNKAYYEAGMFFDELLQYRLVNKSPTIISFDNEVSMVARADVSDGRCGQLVSALSQADRTDGNFPELVKNDFKILRIKIKEGV